MFLSITKAGIYGKMAKTLGIIGGGQLGMMLTEAAKEMPEIGNVIVLDPAENCPAVQAGAQLVCADFADAGAIRQLAVLCDIITYEIESGDSRILEQVEKETVINPSPRTLGIIQDKYLQKSLLAKNGIPVADFAEVTPDTIRESADRFGYPVMLKARRDAYDGRGNYLLDSPAQIAPALDYFKQRPMMLERFVKFQMEVSVIAARNTVGQIATYPLVENIHKNNILYTTIAPARTPPGIALDAQRLAERTMQVLEGAGVFGIEMFVAPDDTLLINEIAPRVHNSGHHSLQSSKTSQFEQHLRAITGMPLGDTDLIHPTIMYNILGDAGFEGAYTVCDPHVDNSFLKMYGKQTSRPQRKLGHINIVARNGQTIDDLLPLLERVRQAPIITR